MDIKGKGPWKEKRGNEAVCFQVLAVGEAGSGGGGDGEAVSSEGKLEGESLVTGGGQVSLSLKDSDLE